MTHAGVLCLCSLIKSYRLSHQPPHLPHPTLSLHHTALLPRPTSRFFRFLPPTSLLTFPSFRLCSRRPKVTSTGRPSMRTRCWRLRGAGSWNSSSLSSLNPRASSHLKVSATYKVGHQARSQSLIFSLSFSCEWLKACMSASLCLGKSY